MPFCSNCGTSLGDGARFCGNCGAAAGGASGGGAPSAEQLTGVTTAVREYAETAPSSVTEKKYGQQKWGLFETNYQREKGITTEQSLQEIESYCQQGYASGQQGELAGSTRTTVTTTTYVSAGGGVIKPSGNAAKFSFRLSTADPPDLQDKVAKAGYVYIEGAAGKHYVYKETLEADTLKVRQRLKMQGLSIKSVEFEGLI